MITQETLVEIHVLHKQGMAIRAIARQLGLSRNTVKRYLREPSKPPTYPSRSARASKLDAFKPYIHQRIESAKPHWIPAAVLYREIRARGYDGCETAVRRYVSDVRPKQTDPVVRFETAPGEQLQVDFTTIRRGKRSLKAFVATLGYSRASFVRFTETEKQEDWLNGIESALRYFGGTPKHLLFDNAKCIMIQRDAYGEGEHKWNGKLLQQAEQFGYLAKACRPYRAKTKGKVERFNRYLKESFITPLAASLTETGLELTADLANAYIGPWLAEVAHQREHGTTKQKPAIRLEEERLVFLPLPDDAQDALIPLATPASPPFESLQHSLDVYDQFMEPRV